MAHQSVCNERVQAYQQKLREVHHAALLMLQHIDPHQVPVDCRLPIIGAAGGSGAGAHAQAPPPASALHASPARRPSWPNSRSTPGHAAQQSKEPGAATTLQARQSSATLASPPSGVQTAKSPSTHVGAHTGAGAPHANQAQAAQLLTATTEQRGVRITPQQFKAWLDAQGARHVVTGVPPGGAKATAQARPVVTGGAQPVPAALRSADLGTPAAGVAQGHPACNATAQAVPGSSMAWLLAQQRSYDSRQQQHTARGGPVMAMAGPPGHARSAPQLPPARAVQRPGAHEEPIEISESE